MENKPFDLFNSLISCKAEPTENDVVQLVNELIVKRQLECPRIKSLGRINSSFYSDLFKDIFGYCGPDLLSNPTTIEEESHNAQSIIDTLSLDILSISLSHITGEDIVAKRVSAIYNLLEIFKGYLAIVDQTNTKADFSQISSSSSSQNKCLNLLNEKKTDSLESTKSSTFKSNDKDKLSSEVSVQTKRNLSNKSSIKEPHVVVPEAICIKHLVENDISSFMEDKDKKPLDELYQEVFKQVPRRRVTPVRRSVLIPRCLKTSPKCKTKEFSQGIVSSVSSGGFLTEVKAALPGIEFSKETANVVRNECVDHIKFVSNRLYNMENKKRKAKKYHEDAIAKQRKLRDLAQKEMEVEKRVADTKRARSNQLKVQGAMRDYEQRRARMKSYYNKYHLNHRRKMSQRCSKEEMLLKNVLKERLDLQKEDLNQLNKQMRQAEEEEVKSQQRKSQALTNFYETQVSLLKETAVNQQTAFNFRLQSQRRTLDDFKRETRLKIEAEIKEIQDDLETRDDFHFQEVSANRLRDNWK